VQELPFAVPPLQVRMYWHPRREGDQAHAWLRSVFETLFALE